MDLLLSLFGLINVVVVSPLSRSSVAFVLNNLTGNTHDHTVALRPDTIFGRAVDGGDLPADESLGGRPLHTHLCEYVSKNSGRAEPTCIKP